MPTAEPNTEPLAPRTGWGALHLFCRLGGSFDADAVRAAAAAARDQGVQVVAVALLGHKADLGFVALGPDLWSLQAFQRAVREAGLVPVASYVSLTEVSEYAAGVPEAMKEARLYPQLPPEGMRAFCFYPMSKRRSADYNWYSLDFESRKELMMGLLVEWHMRQFPEQVIEKDDVARAGRQAGVSPLEPDDVFGPPTEGSRPGPDPYSGQTPRLGPLEEIERACIVGRAHGQQDIAGSGQEAHGLPGSCAVDAYGGERTLPDDDRMHELHRHVAAVGRPRWRHTP